MLRIRQPLEAAPPTPGPEECEEEEEEEFLRQEEPQGNLGAQATSSCFWAFRRLGLLVSPERGAELRADRLEVATSPGSRRQLRLRGHPSEVLLQWYLTLRRSDAMGTCKVKRGPGFLHRPSADPRHPKVPRRRASQVRARLLTDLSPFFPLPITVLKVSETPTRFDCSRFQSASS